MIFRTLLLSALIAAGAVACEKSSPTPSAEAAPAEEAAAAPAEEAAEEAAAPAEAPAEEAAGTVEVPEDGKEFDPAVEVAQLPDGVWYCDMGTAHYARQHEGDGTCPLCHMKLKHKE